MMMLACQNNVAEPSQVAITVLCFTTLALFIEIAALYRCGICRELLRRFDIGFAVGNAVLRLICFCCAALPSIAAAACLLASCIFRSAPVSRHLSSMVRHPEICYPEIAMA